MGKVFEDAFTELQADIISICREYVEDRAEKIFICCSAEGNLLSNGFFYQINGKVLHRHKLNDAGTGEWYDVSSERQGMVLRIMMEDVEAMIKLCKEYQREMPTQIKMVYDVATNRVSGNYRYDLVYSNDPLLHPNDIVEEWYQSVKAEVEGAQ